MGPDSKNDLDQYLSQAIAAHQRGQLKQAAAGYEQILGVDPDHVVANQMLGTIALQTIDYARARTLLNRAIELDGNSGIAFHNLARLDEAEGKLDAAASNYRRAAELMPENIHSSYSLANVLTSLGDMEQSEHWYRRTLAIDPTYGQAHRQLARLRDHAAVDDDILAMEKLYPTHGLPPETKMHLAFGLGKAYEDLEDYDKAFAFFSDGNSLKRSQLRFDINSWDEEIDRITNVFTAELFSRHRAENPSQARPIFILGMPRSGTSLVEQILASHSQVHGGGELQTLNLAIMAHMDVRGFPGNVPALDNQALRRMADQYAAETSALNPAVTYITDKKPDNFKLIGMIRLLFPRAVVIHTRRNPLDNCLSLFKNHFSDNGPFYSYDQAELGQYHRGYQRLMRHWHEVLPGFIHDIQYEALVTDQESGTRELLELCDLPFEPACLEFHRTARNVRTASSVQVRKPMYSSSVESWKRYESQLGPLVAALEAK